MYCLSRIKPLTLKWTGTPLYTCTCTCTSLLVSYDSNFAFFYLGDVIWFRPSFTFSALVHIIKQLRIKPVSFCLWKVNLKYVVGTKNITCTYTYPWPRISYLISSFRFYSDRHVFKVLNCFSPFIIQPFNTISNFFHFLKSKIVERLQKKPNELASLRLTLGFTTDTHMKCNPLVSLCFT